MLRLEEITMTIKINAKVCSLFGLPVGLEYSEFIKTNKQKAACCLVMSLREIEVDRPEIKKK